MVRATISMARALLAVRGTFVLSINCRRNAALLRWLIAAGSMHHPHLLPIMNLLQSSMRHKSCLLMMFSLGYGVE